MTGVGTVGVTWDNGDQVADDDISLQVRTQEDGVWSDWSDLTYHEEHGPDPDSDEAKNARPGTDGTVVGEVDSVQVRVEMTDGTLPDDLKLAVVDPGEPDGHRGGGAGDRHLEAPRLRQHGHRRADREH